MDDCPSCFSAQLSLVLSNFPPLFSSVNLDTGPPTVVELTFDQSMDTGVLPPVGTFEGVFDGTPRTPTSLMWDTSTTIDIFFPGTVPSTSGVLNQLSEHANLKSSVGLLSPAPQSIIFFP